MLYDLKFNNSQAAVKDSKTDPHKRFWYEPGHSHVSWIGTCLRIIMHIHINFYVWYHTGLYYGQMCIICN